MNGRINWCALTVIAILLGLTKSAFAESIPDAGGVRKQMEQELAAPVPRDTIPDLPKPPVKKKPKKKTSEKVTVQHFRLVGNTAVPESEIQGAIQSYLNRPLTFEELQAVPTLIMEIYQKAGWMARAYLPKQEIINGEVKIEIVEAIFGETYIEVAPSWIHFPRIKKTVVQDQKTGSLLNLNTIDQGLLLANDLPGINVRGMFQEGAKAGETDLVLQVVADPPLKGAITMDNMGLGLTGKSRTGLNFKLNSVIETGDELKVHAIHSRGSDWGYLEASVPVAHRGLRVGLNGSWMHYRLLAPEFVALQAKGKSESMGADIIFPLQRSPKSNINFKFSGSQAYFHNQASGSVTTHYAIKRYILGLQAETQDSVGYQGVNQASITLTRGLVDLTGSPNQAADAETARTAGWFTKMCYEVSREQYFSEKWSVFLTGYVQQATKNLDSAEKLYLGGNSGMRAYAINVVSGAAGENLNAELRWRAHRNLLVQVFYDWAHLQVNRYHYTDAASPNHYHLQGAGLSIGWNHPSGIGMKAIFAHRVGDGTNTLSSRDRVWVNVGAQF